MFCSQSQAKSRCTHCLNSSKELWAAGPSVSQIILWGTRISMLLTAKPLPARTDTPSHLLCSAAGSARCCQAGSPQQALGHPILWTVISITTVAFNVSHKTKQPLPAFLTRDRSRFQKAKQHFEGRGMGIKVEKARAPPEFTIPGNQPTMLLLHDTHSSCPTTWNRCQGLCLLTLSSEALTGMISRQPWDPLWLMLRWRKHKKRHTGVLVFFRPLNHVFEI